MTSAATATPTLTPAPYALGIDLGGSSVKVVRVDNSGVARPAGNHAFNADAPMQWAEAILDIIHSHTRTHGAPPNHIGLSAPGLASADGRSIATMPGRLQGLEGLDWGRKIGLGLTVPVLNDAHSALLGEAWLGAVRGMRYAVLLTLGTGVGGAALVDGRLLRGHIGRAGHFGHTSLDPDGAPDICGCPASLELAVGNCTIGERSAGRFATTHDLIRAVHQGDLIAHHIWLTSMKALAAGIASAINVIDPEAVIIGGGIARAGRLLLDPVQGFLETMEWRPGGHRARLLFAELGEFAGAIGAARAGLEAGAGLPPTARWEPA